MPGAVRSHAEALAAGAAGLGVGVGEFEAAADHLVRIVEQRALEVERRLRIDHHLRAAGADQNVAALRLGGELQLVAEAVAAAAGDGDPQQVALLLAGDQRRHLGARVGREAHEVFVTFADAFGQRDGTGGSGHRRH